MSELRTVFGDLPLARSFLGQHYKEWRRRGATDRLEVYAITNDLDNTETELLREWEASGFPEE